ncbi:dialkylrecorsinol condensing enzyme [Thiomicrospira sp. S5]|uniref:dialkylrecorsinol condensing enzyme n=1 Tax=Thiomicrospira sp. S5 TaxID=1803865 RepID=UPI000F8A0BB3|nr:dialkylrecorsinol condensing enzyme [Thiomicrospira sp. S5]AZR80918.1 dialkylrecorsinol condensing enzyme [Thiomicrospira sp. S5]
MPKKILILGYSQTGQLNAVLDAIEQPLSNSDAVTVSRRALSPKQPYPFPWSFFQFFDIFPECVYLDAPDNQPLDLDESYDLVILGYQPWFLSPSLPTTAFLKSEQGQAILKDTPVITVIGCRNMWGQAHLKVKALLAAAGAKLIDNVVLTDQGSSLATFITTPVWLLTGRKSGVLNLPDAGIAPDEIRQACRFGYAIRQTLETQDVITDAPMLTGLEAVKADASLLQSEKIGARSFHIWGKLLRAIGPSGSRQRKPVLVIYILFLVLMIITVVPLTMLLRKLFKPLLKNRLDQLETDFEAPSGSGSERLKDFPCP